jgi:signal transduction histidine kinase
MVFDDVMMYTMNHQNIEPGLLSIFRLNEWVLTLFIGVGLVGAIFGWRSFRLWEFIAVGGGVVLLAYLYSDMLYRRLRRWYLPIALTITTVGAILVQHLALLQFSEQSISNDISQNMELGVFFATFIPMIIVTVQYGYRAMLGFTIGSIVLQLLSTMFLITDQVAMIVVWEDVFVRAVIYPIIAFLVSRIVAEQKKDRQALTEQNSHLTQYASTVEQLAISQERNRMARDLHDTLAHSLSAVSIQLEAISRQIKIDPEEAETTLRQTRQIVRQGLKESRRALHALRSSPLDDLGFRLALEQLINDTQTRAGLEISMEMPDEIVGLSPLTEQNIYRITEEALNNVIRHAEASHIEIVIQQNSGLLTLIIADNGVGFEPNIISENERYGLIGMYERAHLCNGKLSIEGREGTTIRLEIMS